MQHYISDSIYGLTLAWIASENSTKLLECRHLDSVFIAGPYLLPPLRCPVSTAPVRGSTPTASELLCPTNSLLASRYLFRPRRDFKSKNSLSGFAPKQTKESSAWRALILCYTGIEPRSPGPFANTLPTWTIGKGTLICVVIRTTFHAKTTWIANIVFFFFFTFFGMKTLEPLSCSG